MSDNTDRPYVLLLQVEPFGEFNLTIRNQIMDAARDKYQWIDASGSRCAFEDGDPVELQNIATEIAERHGTTASVTRMRDPGLGLILPRDLEAMDEFVSSRKYINDEEEEA
tara:strand:+ start:113 stop:445 length:333 start_codon:yes stop_codon:yes gene_type:complete